MDRPLRRAEHASPHRGSVAPLPDSLRRRTRWELEGLDEASLFGYLAQAQRREEIEAVADVNRILVVRYQGFVRSRVLLRVGDLPNDVIDVIVQNVLLDMLKPGFRGTSAGEYVNRIKTIVTGKIADHFRKAMPRTEHESPLVAPPDPGEGEYRDLLDRAGEERRDRIEDRLDQQRLVHEELARLREQNAVHADVAERVTLDDADPQLIADELGLTRENVDQIKSRFKKQLRERLQREDSGG